MDLMNSYLDLFLKVRYLLRMKHVPKMNRFKYENFTLFYNFHFFHLSLGRVLMIASPSEKKKTFKMYMWSKVTGFDGIWTNEE
jgi:hypothetical protein